MVIFPNPAPSTGGVTVTNTTEDLQFTLYNVQGQPMAIEQEFMPGANQTMIHFSNLGAGIYFLITNTGEEWKIVVI